MKVIISVLSVILGAIALTGILTLLGAVNIAFFTDNGISNVIAGVAQVGCSIAFLIFLFIVLLFTTPAKLYKELGGFESGKLVIKPDCADREPHGYFAIWIYSSYTELDITEFYVALNQAMKNSETNYRISRPISLALSSESQYASETNSLRAGGHRKIDIAYAFQGTHQMHFRVINGDSYPASKGDFHLTFEIHGIYRQAPLNLPFDLDFSFDGDTTFTCVQKEVGITLKKGEMGYEAGSVKFL